MQIRKIQRWLFSVVLLYFLIISGWGVSPGSAFASLRPRQMLIEGAILADAKIIELRLLDAASPRQPTQDIRAPFQKAKFILPGQGITENPPSGIKNFQTFTHASGSQLGVLTRPVTATLRLFFLAFDTFKDSFRWTYQKGSNGKPPTHLSSGHAMDMKMWEKRLDEMTGSTSSYGTLNFLVDGEEFFPRFLDAVTAARESVHIRTYIFDNDDFAIRIVYTRPGDSEVRNVQLEAIRRAKRYIYLENPYLTDDGILYELIRARRRGVDIRVIIPAKSDKGIMDRSNALAANVMLENGVRVFMYPRMSHVKAAVYDGWVCFGSANFDKLSFRVNREIDLATSHPEAVRNQIDRLFIPDFKSSKELKEKIPVKTHDYLLELVADQL